MRFHGFLESINNTMHKIYQLSLVFVFLCMMINGFAASATPVEPWTWEVNTDIRPTDPDGYYIPTEEAYLDFYVKPSATTSLINYSILAMDDHEKEFHKTGPTTINASEGYEYRGKDTISLIKSSHSPQGSENKIEITVYGKNKSIDIPEVHRIVFLVKDPGKFKIIKFNDINKNGIKDGGENGLPWEFSIFYGNGTVVRDRFGQPLAPKTDERGENLVELRPGSYRVIEEDRPGYVNTRPKQIDWDLKSGETKDLLFANVKIITFRVVKFEDLNGNGVMDPGERRLSGWDFSINGGKPQTTDINGEILLLNQTAGKYTIAEVMSPERKADGWRSSTPTQDITLSPGDDASLFFGNVPPAVITILKFRDDNGNGLQERNEPGLPGWSFSKDGIVLPGATDENGELRLSVEAGRHFIEEQPRRGEVWIHTTPNKREIVINGKESKIVIFGNRLPQRIYKFSDANANGRMDGTEGLAGWKFAIQSGGIRYSKVTDANGMAILDDIPIGEYQVTEGWDANIEETYYNVTPLSQRLIVPGGDLFFQNEEYKKVKIFKFQDDNRNGRLDKGERGLARDFLIEENGMRRLIRTDSQGLATIKVRNDRDYTVAESKKAYWCNSTPVLQKLLAGSKQDKLFFGNYLCRPLPEIEVIKFYDRNGNGIRDIGEEGLAAWNFTVSRINSDGQARLATLTTNEMGIANLVLPSAGRYLVEEVPKENWTATTPTTMPVDAVWGQNVTLEFGNAVNDPCNCPVPRPGLAGTPDLNISKEAKLVAGKNGCTAVEYNITVCPLDRQIPTDVVIALDTSGSVIWAQEGLVGEISTFLQSMKGKNVRVGLVSWNEQYIVEGTLDEGLDDLVTKAENVSFPVIGTLTHYPNSMDGALKVFADSRPRQEARKVIVLITDADRDPNRVLSSYPGKGYTVYSLVVGGKGNAITYQMLNKLAAEQNGTVINITDLEDVNSELEKISLKTVPGVLNDVYLVDTLPSYLGSDIDFLAKSPGKVTRNNDSQDWSTTTLEWNIGDLKGCWTSRFQAPFCWKVPADARQRSPAAVSEIRYSNVTSGKPEKAMLPEGEIDIRATKAEPVSYVPEKKEKEQPGFEAALFLVGLIGAWICMGRK